MLKNTGKHCMNKLIGKITRAEVGLGGPYNSMYGLFLEIVISANFSTYATFNVFKGTTLYSTRVSSLEEAVSLIEDSNSIVKILEDAEVQYVSELVGKNVECILENKDILVSWSILKNLF